MLLSYPANMYAETPQDIYDYTKAYCDATDLAVMLFPVPLWGFNRVHEFDIEAKLIRRLIDDCPNVAAVKAEGGMPSFMHWIECHRLFGKEIVISNPLEKDMIPLAQLAPVQFSATSNTEYFGPMIPHIFKLLQKGDFDEATRLYWQINPARKANMVTSAYMAADQLPASHAVEVSGLVERLQRRPDAPADRAAQRCTPWRRCATV